MSTFKKCKVVLLKSQTPSQLGLCTLSPGKEGLIHRDLSKVIPFLKNAYHLYITSNDEIKVGDLVIENRNGNLNVATINDECEIAKDIQSKIIATTNKELEFIPNHSLLNVGFLLPLIPKSFISRYAGSFNTSSLIEDVMVEYEVKAIDSFKSEIYLSSKDSKQFIDTCTIVSSNPKVNTKDNTISIKQLKETFTRDEVIKLLDKHSNDVLSKHYEDGVLNNLKWIFENL